MIKQRVIRTIFQGVVSGLTFLPLILGAVSEHFTNEYVLIALAVSVSVQGVLAKVMAIPGLNGWLETYTPLGIEPKSSV